MKSYDYTHRQGIRNISWEEFARLAARLAEKLDQAGVEVIVGIAGLEGAGLARGRR